MDRRFVPPKEICYCGKSLVSFLLSSSSNIWLCEDCFRSVLFKQFMKNGMKL